MARVYTGKDPDNAPRIAFIPMTPARRHTPVLLESVVELLAPRQGQTFLDCTAGLGGHAAAIAARLGPSGTVILNDVDPANLTKASETVGALGVRTVSLRGNFADAPRVLAERGLAADMVLADLGFASSQMDDPARGLAFSSDGPLDMRLDPSLATTAADLVASLPESELTRIIGEFGEDRDARRIARKLVEARRERPISTTRQLAELVRQASGRRSAGAIDPATRTFQALRIAVNDELGSLEALLSAVERGAGAAGGKPGWLNPGARVAIISFHSLEDRPVKRSFAGLVERGLATGLTRRPVEADERELAANPRARSAKLRAIRLTG
jgi:16S rRNA (cytosine1402-N4)-methyltransferase